MSRFLSTSIISLLLTQLNQTPTSLCQAQTVSSTSPIGQTLELSTTQSSELTSSCSLDIVILQDTTVGLENDLRFIATDDNLGELGRFLNESFPNSQVGLLSFRDKPIWSLGTEDGDYCAKFESDFTSNFSTLFAQYNKLIAYGGGDFWENQFGALAIAAQTSKFSWRQSVPSNVNVIKLFILVTDSAPHHEQDGKSTAYTQLKPYTESFDDADWHTKCVSEDYPSADVLKRLFRDKDIQTVFVTNENSGSDLPKRAYNWLNDFLGQPKEFVVSSGNHSVNFFPALKVALDTLKQTKCKAGCDLDTPGRESPPKENRDELLRQCLLENNVISAVHWPGTAQYVDGIEPLDLFYPVQYPLIYVLPTTTAEVAGLMTCTHQTGHNVVVRGGGHDYGGYSYGQNGDVILHLERMANITIDQITGQIEADAGIRLSPFIYQIATNGGWMIPTGACTSLGLSGHIQGGGYGYYTRAFGLATDYLIGAEMVLVNGTIVQATPGTDLFWAIQGAGGGNIGVVTKFRIQAFKPPPLMTAMSIFYPRLSVKKVLYAARHFAKAMPKNLALSVLIDARGVPIQVSYMGNLTETRKALRPLTNEVGFGLETPLEGPFLVNFGELSITNILDTQTPVGVPPVLHRLANVSNATDVPADEGNTSANQDDDVSPLRKFSPGVGIRKVVTLDDLDTPPDYHATRTYFKPHSLVWTEEFPLTEDCLDKLISVTQVTPLSFGFALEIMGGDNSALRWRSWNETGFSLRNMTWIAHLYARSFLPLTQVDVNFVDKVYYTLKPCAAPRTYLNYKDPELGQDSKDPVTGLISGNAPEALLEYHGEYHLQRLKEIKQKYNPENQMWYPQAIRLDE